VDKSAKSNTHGRAFEHETVRLLLALGASPHQRTIEYQDRDADKLGVCEQKVRARIEQIAPRVAKWIVQQASPLAGLLVERLGDSSKDVTDIRILRGTSEVLSISMKFNHNALRHPRPYSLAQACGFEKESEQDQRHRTAMIKATDSLVKYAITADCRVFRQLPDHVRLKMLDGVVQASSESIRKWTTDRGPYVATSLFNYMVCPGGGFYKVIAAKRKGNPVEVQDYRNIANPTTVEIIPDKATYLRMQFDNGWTIRIRIHTAKREFSINGRQLDLKFDARRECGDVASVSLP
jgi:hypothetical protein